MDKRDIEFFIEDLLKNFHLYRKEDIKLDLTWLLDHMKKNGK
jgi:hypothetical protein